MVKNKNDPNRKEKVVSLILDPVTVRLILHCIYLLDHDNEVQDSNVIFAVPLIQS